MFVSTHPHRIFFHILLVRNAPLLRNAELSRTTSKERRRKHNALSSFTDWMHFYFLPGCQFFGDSFNSGDIHHVIIKLYSKWQCLSMTVYDVPKVHTSLLQSPELENTAQDAARVHLGRSGQCQKKAVLFKYITPNLKINNTNDRTISPSIFKGSDFELTLYRAKSDCVRPGVGRARVFAWVPLQELIAGALAVAEAHAYCTLINCRYWQFITL